MFNMKYCVDLAVNFFFFFFFFILGVLGSLENKKLANVGARRYGCKVMQAPNLPSSNSDIVIWCFIIAEVTLTFLTKLPLCKSDCSSPKM